MRGWGIESGSPEPLPTSNGAYPMPSITIHPLVFNDLDDLRDLEPPDHAALLAHLRWCISTPYALAVKAVFGEALICGVATATVHGSAGWLGAHRIHPHVRDGDAGTLLRTALMEALLARGCTTISVLAEPAQLPAFQVLGFTPEAHYHRHGGGQCEQPDADEVVLYAPEHALGVLHMVRMACGEDRSELIREHLYVGHVFVQKGRVLGCYLPLLGDGFICASTAHAGSELLRWHLFNERTVVVPEGNATALQFLQERNYQPTGELVRMRHGARVPWQPDMLYGRGSAWLG